MRLQTGRIQPAVKTIGLLKDLILRLSQSLWQTIKPVFKVICINRRCFC